MSADRLFRFFAKGRRRARGFGWALAINICGGKSAWNLEVDKGATLRWGPHSGLSLGDNVYFGVGVVVDVPSTACLEVGDNCKIMHYTVVAAAEKISIGSWTQVAEHCSIRDANHGMDCNTEIARQPMESSAVTLGDDVWVGRGVAVLKGVEVGQGSIVGANSVCVRDTPAYSVAVGIPARVAKQRRSVGHHLTQVSEDQELD